MAYLRGVHIPGRPENNSVLRELMLMTAFEMENTAEDLIFSGQLKVPMYMGAQASTRTEILNKELANLKHASQLRMLHVVNPEASPSSLKTADLFKFMTKHGVLDQWAQKHEKNAK